MVHFYSALLVHFTSAFDNYGLICLKCLNSEDNQYFVTDEFGGVLKYVEKLGFSKKIEQELYKLGEIYGGILDLSEPDPEQMVGFHTIEEVRYYLYYKLYVATLLSGEYKQGNLLLYGFDTVYGNSQKKTIYTRLKNISNTFQNLQIKI